MKKKLFTILLSFITVLSLAAPVYATPADEKKLDDLIVQPYWTYLWILSNHLEIVGNTANMTGQIQAYSPVQQVRITTYLQKRVNGNWTVINNYSQLFSGTVGFWGKTTSVASGYDYRLLTYFYAYINGSIVESTSITSNIVYCG